MIFLGILSGIVVLGLTCIVLMIAEVIKVKEE